MTYTPTLQAGLAAHGIDVHEIEAEHFADLVAEAADVRHWDAVKAAADREQVTTNEVVEAAQQIVQRRRVRQDRSQERERKLALHDALLALYGS